MQCKVDLKDLVELYAQCQNLFDSCTPTKIERILKGYEANDILLLRRNLLSQQIVDMLDATLSKKTNLRIGASPFVADVDEILAKIDGD